MKPFLFIIGLLSTLGYCQSPQDIFDSSANLYLQDQNKAALKQLEMGLEKFPENEKLKALKQRIEQQSEQDNSEEGDQEEGEKTEDQQQNQKEKDSEDRSGQQDGQDQGDQGEGSSDEKPMDADNPDINSNSPSNAELEEQRYDQVLKALEEQERNTQRRLMMGKTKSNRGRNQKDW